MSQHASRLDISRSYLFLLPIFASLFTFTVAADLAPTVDCSVDPNDCLVEFWGHVPHTWDDGDANTEDRIRLRGRLVSPVGSGPFPAVVVLHGSGGMWHETPEEDGPMGAMYGQFDDWASLLVQDGYVALILDSFSDRADLHPPNPPGNSSGFKQLLPPEDADVAPVYERSRDAFDAITYLRTLTEVDGDRIGVLGFSHGGGGVAGALVDGPAARAAIPQFTVSSSSSPDPGPHDVPSPADPPNNQGFDCGVAYYPGALFYSYFGSSAEDQGFYRPNVPLRMIYGDQDSLWTTGYPEALRNKAIFNGASAMTGNELTLSTYAGVGHSFDSSGSQEATDARAETLAFFAGCLSGARVEGHAWADIDGNGFQDLNETDLEGVEVDLSGDDTSNAQTGAAGAYGFGVTAGSYNLHFSTPTGYTLITGGDSAADGSGDVAVALANNETLSNVDVAFQPLGYADIDGIVWSDDGDGVRGGNEAGVGGMTVSLETALGTPVDSALTANDGSYSFTNVLPGNYRLRLDAERWQAIAGPDSVLDGSMTSADFFADASASVIADAAIEPRCEDFPLIAWGSNWQYLIDADAGTGWQTLGYDTAGWGEGNGLLANTSSDLLTSLPTDDRITRYFRKEFELADASWISDLEMKLERDDGAIVYLNGVEVLRSNLPNVVTPTTKAILPSWEIVEQVLDPLLLDDGTNVIAVELHQRYNTNTPDWAFDFELRGEACQPCHVGAIEMPVLADTYLQQDDAGKMRGERTNVWVKGVTNSHRNALLSFEKPLWHIGDSVLSAELLLSVTNDSGAYHRVHEMLTDWQELAATWDTSGGTPWSGAESPIHYGADTVAVAHTEDGVGIYRLGLTTEGLDRLLIWLEGGVDHRGWLLLGQDGDSDSLEFDSREGNTPPKLRIVYSDTTCNP